MRRTLVALIFLASQIALASDPAIEPEARNYKELLKRCQGNSCCESSARRVEQVKGFVLKNPKAQCPRGYQFEMQKCVGTYRWCEPVK